MKPSTFVDMSTTRNSLSLALITCSIGLLMAFQFFWLRKVYRDEERGFQKETSFIFRNMMFALTDSVIQKSIQDPRIVGVAKKFDSLLYEERYTDTLPPIIRDSSANIQVYINQGAHDDDSIGRGLKPLADRIRRGKEHRVFSLGLNLDTIPIAKINQEYKRNLSKAGIEIPFVITSKDSSNRHLAGNDFDQEKIILTPPGAFEIDFPGLQWIILKKIVPQILFTFVLTLITISSFILLYRSLRSQQRLMEIKNDFINNMTHELKTPVATVSVAIEALQNFNVLDNPKRASEYLTIAQNELKRLTLMTDKILKTSVFEKNGVDMHLGNVDVHNMVIDVIDSMELVAKKQDAIITLEKEGEDFTINGSEEHLSNIFYNLIDNAIKYSPEKPNIKIILKEFASQITFSIQDNGIGIPKTYQRKIFEKFFRVPGGDVHNTKGYGLGLSFVASVVKSHGGNVTVESEEGKGSRFVVTLPKRIS